jgi:predicted acyltransferase
MTSSPHISRSAQSDPASPDRRPTARLQSLDVFRGLTIAAMILVNNPGSWASIYPPLRHADWHGCTPTDLIFPFFLFIVGSAMALSGRKPGVGLGPTYARIGRRVLVLIALGLLLAWFPKFDLATLRFPGVLQRIALCYLLASIITLHARLWVQALIAALLLAGYSAALWLVPVPGIGAGVLTPEGNLGGWLDRVLMGKHIYKGGPHDPEGLLGTLPATATVLIGFWAGRFVKAAERTWRTVILLLGAGVACVLAGWWLAHVDVPLNKPMWSSSYVVFTAGWALITLGACFASSEVLGWRKFGRPWEIYGVNAIFAFVASGLLARVLGWISFVPDGADAAVRLNQLIFNRGFASWLTPMNASLAYAVVNVMLWWVVCWGMWRKRWILKV